MSVSNRISIALCTYSKNNRCDQVHVVHVYYHLQNIAVCSYHSLLSSSPSSRWLWPWVRPWFMFLLFAWFIFWRGMSFWLAFRLRAWSGSGLMTRSFRRLGMWSSSPRRMRLWLVIWWRSWSWSTTTWTSRRCRMWMLFTASFGRLWLITWMWPTQFWVRQRRRRRMSFSLWRWRQRPWSWERPFSCRTRSFFDKSNFLSQELLLVKRL